MSAYKCKNFGSCSKADRGEEFSLQAGTEERCPECGFPLGSSDAAADGQSSGGKRKRQRAHVLAGAGIAVLLAAGSALAYFGWKEYMAPRRLAFGNSAPGAAMSLPVSAPAPQAGGAASSGRVAGSAPPPAAPEASAAPVVAKIDPVLGAEAPLRQTCDDATRARRPDADRVCRRAAAVTLMNTGAQAAVAGHLEQAERDYLAAKEKDPDYPELYFNLALLKARQNRGSEAMDNLLLASTKGFRRPSSIKDEPLLQKLKNGNPQWRAQIEAMEAAK